MAPDLRRSLRSWWALSLPCVLACSAASPGPASSPATANAATQHWPVAEKQLQFTLAPRSVAIEPAALLGILGQQLQRSYAVLSKQPDPVYYLAYQVTEQHSFSIAAAEAASLYAKEDRQRLLDVDMRIGSSQRDQTHRLPGEVMESTFHALRALPLEDGDALHTALWLATDDEYEQARQQWMRVQASDQRQTEEDEPDVADFSAAQPAVWSEAPAQVTLDLNSWQARLAGVSALARQYPDIMSSSARLDVVAETRSFVNNEGTRLQTAGVRVRLSLEAATLSSDGMPLSRYETIDLRAVAQIPDDTQLLARFKRVLDDVRALRAAPLIEPYAGPAILDGKAAGVFFHEIFGHRIEGHRQDDETEGQTFAALIGQQILSANLSIYDDPTLFRLNGTELNGFYRFDDEGVAAQRALLVQDGVLRNFLMSRAPARQFAESNGHGRRQPGHGVVARQANLVLEPREVVSPQTLKQALIAEVRRQGLPYGLRFSEITGGYTQTTRGDTQAFKVMPVMVYRVFPDGREELVRGVDMEGTPLTALSKIMLAANDFQTFNGVCGAESGWVPVSAISPSVLISQIEVARQEQTEFRPPVLPPPTANAGATP